MTPSGVSFTRDSATASKSATASRLQNSTAGPSRGPPTRSTQRSSGERELELDVHGRRTDTDLWHGVERGNARRRAPGELALRGRRDGSAA